MIKNTRGKSKVTVLVPLAIIVALTGLAYAFGTLKKEQDMLVHFKLSKADKKLFDGSMSIRTNEPSKVVGQNGDSLVIIEMIGQTVSYVGYEFKMKVCGQQGSLIDAATAAALYCGEDFSSVSLNGEVGKEQTVHVDGLELKFGVEKISEDSN